MCGLMVSIKNRGNNFFIQKRGQDHTSSYERNGLTFVHNLLSITGDFTPQPFIDGDIVCIYNGEIYGHSFIKSDGENLIPLYKRYGEDFPQYLDGEYAIALYDFGKGKAYFITDLFATKPLWRNGIECASYQSGVGGHKIKANTIETVDLRTGEATSKQYHQWDWIQKKDSYDDCLLALEKAVLKRYKPRCFIGLSSGYDSGTIASILRDKDFKSYSIIASENKEIIRQRAIILKDIQIIADFDIKKQEENLKDAEDFNYAIRYDDRIHTGSYKNDYAAKALSHICELANKEGRKVYLSGAGADEIMSDYSLIPNQSEFKGVYPNELKEWSNFTQSCQYSYLGKEECVGGRWNIETRYPFLDKDLVQEFLWLIPELKNKNYKAPLFEYLTRSDFPFQKNEKIGFSI